MGRGWSAARHIIVKVSSKLNMKIVEAGYHSKSNILESFLGLGKEYAKVYSGGVLTGNIVLGIKRGKIIVDSEKLVSVSMTMIMITAITIKLRNPKMVLLLSIEDPYSQFQVGNSNISSITYLSCL